MQSEMQKILDRVSKLLNLAGNNPNENEATAAMEKAYAILAEHNLTLSEVQAHGAKESVNDREMLKTDTTFMERYYGCIWLAVAKAHFCTCFKTRPNPKKYQTYYTLIGRSINVLVAAQLAVYLCQTVRRLTNEASRGKEHSYKNAFLAGLSYRLCARISELKEEKGKGLVLWTGAEEEANLAFMQNQGVTTKALAKRDVYLNGEAFVKGQEAGDNVSLNQQMASRKQAAIA